MRFIKILLSCVITPVLISGCFPRVPPGCTSLVEETMGAIHVKGLTIPLGGTEAIKIGEGRYTPAERQKISDAILRVNEYRLAQCNVLSLLISLNPQPVDRIATIGEKVAKSNEMILRTTEEIRKNPNTAQVVEVIKAKEAELPKDEKGAGLDNRNPLSLDAVREKLGELITSVNDNSKKIDNLKNPSSKRHFTEKFSVTGFTAGKSMLTPAMRGEILTQVSRLIEAAPKGELLQFDVVGYTDNSGAYLQNLQLGLARAHSVGFVLQNESLGRRAILRTVTSGGAIKGSGDARRVEVYALSI